MRHPNASFKPKELELIEKWNYAVAPESISISDIRRTPLQVSADVADIFYSGARKNSVVQKTMNDVAFGGFFLATINNYPSTNAPSFVFEVYSIEDDEELTSEITRKSMQNPYAKSPILFVPIDVDIDVMIDRNEI